MTTTMEHSGNHLGAARRLENRLTEAFDELLNGFVDPREPYFDADGRWIGLLGDLSGGSACWAPRDEGQLREVRNQCRLLALTNEFAINGHENRISYIVGSGHTYRAAARRKAPDGSELAAQVQETLDEFIEANEWRRRQAEAVRRCDRDGEAFLRFFVTGDGGTRVRFVEPGQIVTPPRLSNRANVSFGILADEQDVETVLAYYIDGAAVDASEIQHRKANVDGNVRRGLPLFFPVRKNLERAEKLLRNMSTVAEIQSAIAIIRKHNAGVKSTVQQFAAASATGSNVNGGTNGGAAHYKRYPAGTILDAPGGIEYDFPAAALDAGRYVAVLQAELRAIASRLVMPEFMLTSDASNSNYASTMVAEGPAVKMFERLQADQIQWDLAVMWRVVENAIRAGRLPREALKLVEIQVSPPSLRVRDALREAQVHRIEFESGVLSPQTWSRRSGLDYDQEQANIRGHGTRADADL